MPSMVMFSAEKRERSPSMCRALLTVFIMTDGVSIVHTDRVVGRLQFRMSVAPLEFLHRHPGTANDICNSTAGGANRGLRRSSGLLFCLEFLCCSVVVYSHVFMGILVGMITFFLLVGCWDDNIFLLLVVLFFLSFSARHQQWRSIFFFVVFLTHFQSLLRDNLI